MCSMKNSFPTLRKFSLTLSAFLLAFCVAGSCSAMEITEQELTQLEVNLNQLEANNKKSQEELQTLKRELTVLTVQSENQQRLLETANESLQKYEKDMKAKLKRSKTERNIAICLAIFLLIKK